MANDILIMIHVVCVRACVGGCMGSRLGVYLGVLISLISHYSFECNMPTRAYSLRLCRSKPKQRQRRRRRRFSSSSKKAEEVSEIYEWVLPLAVPDQPLLVAVPRRSLSSFVLFRPRPVKAAPPTPSLSPAPFRGTISPTPTLRLERRRG